MSKDPKLDAAGKTWACLFKNGHYRVVHVDPFPNENDPRYWLLPRLAEIVSKDYCFAEPKPAYEVALRENRSRLRSKLHEVLEISDASRRLLDEAKDLKLELIETRI